MLFTRSSSLWFCIIPNPKIESERTMFYNCVQHLTRIAGSQSLSDFERMTSGRFLRSEKHNGISVYYTFTSWLFWRKWQPKLGKLSKTCFCIKTGSFPIATSYYWKNFIKEKTFLILTLCWFWLTKFKFFYSRAENQIWDWTSCIQVK